MLALAIERLAGLSGASRFLVYAGLAVGASICAAGAYVTWHHEVFKSGYTAALLDIARADKAAIDSATVKRNAWRACRDAGRSWDQSAGRCQ